MLRLNLFRNVVKSARCSTNSTIRYMSSQGDDIWSWIPPRDKSERTKDSFTIPTIKGVMLTPEEVRDSLVSQGAEDVIILPLKENMDTITTFVIATGKSHRHLRKMSESVVIALKDRRLHYALGCGGVEGESDDDWQCVDCHKFLVHLLLPETRKHVDLETLWTMEKRPAVVFSNDPKEYEENFVRMLERFPCPEDYIKSPELATKDINEVVGKL